MPLKSQRGHAHPEFEAETREGSFQRVENEFKALLYSTDSESVYEIMRKKQLKKCQNNLISCDIAFSRLP